MSAKTRKKKSGQDASKKRQRMRAAVAERHAMAGPEKGSTDEVDGVKYKPGSGSDRNQSPQARHANQ
jgi:hypothetical protein